MASTRGGHRRGTGLNRIAALAAAAVILTGCATSLPSAPDDADLQKWHGDPVVTTDKQGYPPAGARAANPRQGDVSP